MSNHNHKREEKIKAAVLINLLFTIIEIVGGIWTNSLAILSDALHDFGDSIFLLSSWGLEKASQKGADQKRTFGYQRLSLLSSFLAGFVLIVGSMFILSRAIPRLMNPEHVNAEGMIALSIIGMLFNGAAFIKLKKGESANEKMISWHLLEDALGWIVIFIGSSLMFFWDNHSIDSIMTIGYTAFILWGVVKNLKESFNIFLQGVPAHIDLDLIKKSLLNFNGVIGVHDIHIWSLEGETDVFSAHIVVKNGLLINSDKTRRIIKDELKNHHIEHSTIELESKLYCSGIECEVR